MDPPRGPIEELRQVLKQQIMRSTNTTATDHTPAGAPATQTMETTSVDLTQRLPHDLLVNVLRRLQASLHSLAASRCVCKAWRAVVDTSQLLTGLLPRSLAGIFVHVSHDTLPKYFSLMPPTEIAAFDYMDTQDVERLTTAQHCNGLLLLGDKEARVLNPVTRQWTILPPPPPMRTPGMENMYAPAHRFTDCHDQYLVFDPTKSPHYEVFLIKHVPWIPWPDCNNLMDDYVQEKEWPPSTFVLLVFSSRTNRWEERPFVRQGEAARTIGDMLEEYPSGHPYAAYWAGALYVRQQDIFMRITLSSHKYQVTELPKSLHGNQFACRLGKSEKGVYCALFSRDGFGLQIWYLDETCDQINWMLKCDVNLHSLLEFFYRENSDTPLGVQCASDERDRSNVTGSRDRSEQSHIRYSLLGFHPNEEIIFFHTPLKRVVACHFDSFVIEDLGCLLTESQYGICLSFPYTPCRMTTGFSSNK